MNNYIDCLNRVDFTKDHSELVFFDVGCNVNETSNNDVLDDFTKLALSKYPDAKCVGIEPVHWQKYEERWGDNSNVTVVKKALSNKNESQDFYVPQAHGLSSLIDREVFHTWGEDQIPNKVQVECITLDSLSDELGIEIIDYLKLDTEGGEFLILEGSENLLNSKRINLIQMEWGCWTDIGMSIQKMDEYLSKFDYSNVHQNSTEVLYALN